MPEIYGDQVQPCRRERNKKHPLRRHKRAGSARVVPCIRMIDDLRQFYRVSRQAHDGYAARPDRMDADHCVRQRTE